jgi:GAF domain-containing protein
VALSGETLLIHGDRLKKFKVSSLGMAAVVTPIKVKNEVIGLLIVIRKALKAFSEVEQTLLEAVADYASISLVNEQLFRALAQTAEAAREGEKQQNLVVKSLRQAVQTEMQGIMYPLGLMMTGKTGVLTAEQRQALASAESAMQRLATVVSKISPSEK